MLTNNTGTTVSSYGIYIISSSNNTFTNNTGIGDGGGGIIVTGSLNNTLTNNVGTSNSLQGIILQDSSENTLMNNVGTSTLGDGIVLFPTSPNNILTNNTGTSDSGKGIFVESGSNNTFTNNTGVSNSGIALAFQTTAQNNTFDNTTLRTNNSWITTDSDSGGNNISNTTFDSINGSIRSINLSTIPIGITVDVLNLNTSFNNSFLNSTNFSFLNTSAQITFDGLPFSNPRPLVDFEDDGTFAACNSPQCVEDSYNGSTFVFNVSSFTSYAAQESPFCPLNITTSTTLTENVTCSATAINILADNLTLDCAGYTINYSSTTAGYGINATNRNNVTIKNCDVRQTNGSVSPAHAIFLSATENSTVINTSATANGSSSAAIQVETGRNNTVTNSSAQSEQYSGIYVTGGNNNTINNTFAASFSPGSAGIQLFSTRNNIVTNSYARGLNTA